MNGWYLKFLDDPRFVKMVHTLDNHMKFLASKGYYCPREKADLIEVDDKNDMWSSGILGESNPKQLIDTIVYLLGTHFALRAGKEHKALRVGECSQFKIKTDKSGDCYLEYAEDTSKNYTGGLKHRRLEHKVARAYENEAYPDRCLVHLFCKYMSLRPTSEKCSTDFYLQPLSNPKDNKCWYTTKPMGVNYLASIVRNLAQKLGIEGKFSNHSCRASAASCMFQNNMEEQLVMDRTGHRSTAVRSYKRVSGKQLRDVSKILYGQEVTGNEAKKPCLETVAKPPKTEVEPCVSDEKTDNVSTGESSSKLCFNFTINVNK